MSIDEGYIKFDMHWEESNPTHHSELLRELTFWRNKMHEYQFIGHDTIHNVGFGNISHRIPDSQHFIISGTQTGHFKNIQSEHFTTVTQYNIARNYLFCKGPIKASSESLTHAAIYDTNKFIQGVIHIHYAPLWNKLKGKLPTTRAIIPYGTPEMAKEIRRLFKETELLKTRVLVMAGHEDGIIAFGETLQEAATAIFERYYDLS